MPLSIDLALVMFGGIVLGLAAAMLVGQAVGGALGALAARISGGLKSSR